MTIVLFMWRVGLITLNVVCLFVLLNRYRIRHKIWDGTTKDYWWTLLLWSIAAFVTAWQGLVQSRPLSAALVFVTIANIAIPIGLYRKASEYDSTQNIR